MYAIEANKDYTTGEPRRHDTFYFEEADIYIQVENAIFKVHRCFLTVRSSVLRDMFNTPQGSRIQNNTDQKPFVLTGDTAAAWETFFRSIYSTTLLKSDASFTDKELIALLRIADKYEMQSNKEEILSHLKKTVTKYGFVDLMVASHIVGSDSLREQAMQGLIASKEELTLEDAERMGLEATYEAFVGRLRCNKCGTVCGVRCPTCKKYLRQ